MLLGRTPFFSAYQPIKQNGTGPTSPTASQHKAEINTLCSLKQDLIPKLGLQESKAGGEGTDWHCRCPSKVQRGGNGDCRVTARASEVAVGEAGLSRWFFAETTS